MQNRWCILFPLVQSYQLHWFFFSLPTAAAPAANLVRWWASTLHQICKRRSKSCSTIHTYVLNFRYPADSSIPPPHLLLDCVWNGAKIGLPFQCTKKTNNDIVVGHGNHHHKTKYGRMIFLSSDNVCVWEDDIDGQNYHSISNLRQQENAFDFPIQTSYKMALKNLYLMAASRKKKKTVPSHKVNPPRLNLTLKFLPKSLKNIILRHFLSIATLISISYLVKNLRFRYLVVATIKVGLRRFDFLYTIITSPP